MKQKLQNDERMYAAMFGEDSICVQEKGNVSIENIDEAIADCQGMLQYSLDQNDQAEVSYWRKMLQKNKVMRRELLTA